MKIISFSASAVALALSPITSASAEEVNWSGAYVGVHMGYASLKPDYTEPDEPTLDANVKTDGVIGGALTGFNIDTNSVVLGVEADFGLADANARSRSINDYTAFDLKWNGHLRARVGYPVGQALIYAAGGLALARIEVDDVDAGWGKHTKTHTGYTIGGGVEYAATDSLTIRGEYLYDGYEKTNASINGEYGYPFSVDPSEHTIRAAVAYRF